MLNQTVDTKSKVYNYEQGIVLSPRSLTGTHKCIT